MTEQLSLHFKCYRYKGFISDFMLVYINKNTLFTIGI